MKNKLLAWLLVIGFIKEAAWILMTPIFQVPDEPSHFSYIQLVAEKKRLPRPRRDVVSSVELMETAKSVNFDWQISHPVWRGYAADWRGIIEAIDASGQSEFVSNPDLTSLKRPILYYLLSAIVYSIFGAQNIIWRLMAIRLVSLAFQLLTVWLTYKIAVKLTKKEWPSLAAAAAVAFHPGFSFLSGGVTYETMAAAAVALFIYLYLSKKNKWWLVLTASLGVMIKPDLIFLWVFLIGFKIIIAIVILGLLSPVMSQVVRGRYVFLDAWLYAIPLKEYSVTVDNLWRNLTGGQVMTKTWQYLNVLVRVHYHQVFAWYWGVFGWLEKTLPLAVYTGLKLISAVAGLGLFRYLKKYQLLLIAVLLQAAIVLANDWLVFVSTGEIYGIQGRYFYSAISAQMILLTLGLSRFIAPKIIIAGFAGLNVIGLVSLYQYFGWVW